MTKPVTIYGRDACGYCEKAREHLAKLGIPFSYINLTSEPGRRAELVGRMGREPDTLPQIWVKQDYVGGCDDLTVIPAAHLQAMVGGA